MENEKKTPEENAARSPMDEIMDGFYDLSRLYSTEKPAEKKPPEAPVSREEELRRKDEERRRIELEAVREDIERRYSMHLENVRSKTDDASAEPKKSYIEIPSGRDAVKEELERIDSLIDDGLDGGKPSVKENAAPSGAVPTKKERQEKPVQAKKKKTAKAPRFDPYDVNAVYAFVYIFGDVIYRFFARIFEIVFGIISYPFKKAHKAVSAATAGSKMRFRRYVQNTAKETAYFRTEIKNAGKSIRKAVKNPFSLPSVLIHYVRKAFSRHRDLLKTCFNIALPIAALAVLAATVNYWNSVTFALEVIYNEKSIGYISDESVYIEAKDMVKDRLSSVGTDESDANDEASLNTVNFNARYGLSLVSLEELDDARTISDKIIENSVENLTHACGVYIDGEFICAVKNEADAKTVFYDILEPYEKEAEAGGYVVGFAESLDYVQGLYSSEESILWDASELSAALNGEKPAQYVYTANGEDSVEDIAAKYGVSAEKLTGDNPGTDFEELHEGDVVPIKISPKYVSIKKTVTSTSVRDIEFETVKRRDVTKFSGYRVVQQQGVNGSERVTKTEIYIDGVLDDTEYSYETLVEPIDEIVTVGTKTTYGGIYVGEASEKGFLWPAPSCHYVSSPYGWRSSGWHNGIDLCRAGGGAYGTPVIASRSGTVEVVQRSSSGYGNMVLINHGDGYKTRYAHMISGSILVSVGQRVEAGQTIGKVGSTGNSTGPHLHFEVIWQGETQNPKGYIS